MNIWLINHYAVPIKYYYLARPTNFAKYLIRKGHTVTIFCASTVHNANVNLITDGSLYREDVIDGIHYVYVKCSDYRGNGLSRVHNMGQFANRLIKVCKYFDKPDAIVATSMPPMSCAMGIHLARKYKCRGIAEIADLWPESIVAYNIAGKHNPAVLYLRRLEKWIYTHADDVIFTMEGAYNYIIEQGWEKCVPHEKVHYINNGVDLEVFEYNRSNFHVEDEDLSNDKLFTVVYTGSIRRVNNLGLLLDVAKVIQDKSIRFLIWGDGDELALLRQRVLDEKIENVVFKGRVDKKYIPYITSMAGINIAHNSPSELFRFGISFNKAFDYFAAGKPIIADFPSEFNPIVMENAGIEVKIPTAENIASAICKLRNMSEEERERYCRNAYEAAHKYSFEKLSERLEGVIRHEKNDK